MNSTWGEVARGVYGFRNVMVNVYFVCDQPGNGIEGWWLVDTGLPGSAGVIKREAERLFGTGARPRAIVLTHGHFDHVGAARQLATEWDVPVFAHRLEHPYLDGRSAYPPPDPTVGGGAMAWSSKLYPRGPIDLGYRLRPLPSDGRVPDAPAWRWVASPGHSPGHVSLFRDEDRTLIAGDAVITVQQESLLAVWSQTPEVHAPPAYYTTDWVAAGASTRALADLAPETLATGHGRPMHGATMRARLEELARHFDAAIPRRGRYVVEPARADETGVTRVPPAVPPAVPGWVVGATVAAAAAFYAWRRRAGARRAGRPTYRVEHELP